ncbi:hypothetical protein BH11ACT6_BH11ACT6_29780 [soil metagenome]
MNDQSAQLHELPDYWQEKIRSLRSENHELRLRLRTGGISPTPELEELPQHWQSKVAKLRKENGKYRTARNALRTELEALRVTVAGA